MREEILLAEIADAMQLEKFDRAAFDALVERVMITPDGIQVQLKNNSNPMNVGTVRKTA